MSFKAKATRSFETVSSSLWFLPLIFVTASFGLSILTVYVDTHYKYEIQNSWVFFSAGAESARSVLSTIAGSMITIAGVVFSITIVVLSLASSQYGPRLLEGFMKDKVNQSVLGVFISTFLFSILILKSISNDSEVDIPQISVNVSIALSVLSVLFFIYFIHHIAKSIQANQVISRVYDELSETIENYRGINTDYDPEVRDDYEFSVNSKVTTIRSDRNGYIQFIDYNLISEIAAKHSVVVKVLNKPGFYYLSGAAMFEIYSNNRQSETQLSKEDQDDIMQCVNLGSKRTFSQDLEYGFNQLTEIAIRALSPGINDAFTAIYCVDRIFEGLNTLLRQKLPQGFKCSDQNKLTLTYDTFTKQSIIDNAIQQIRQNSNSSIAVKIHLMRMMAALSENLQDSEVTALFINQAEQISETSDTSMMSQQDQNDLESALRQLKAITGHGVPA